MSFLFLDIVHVFKTALLIFFPVDYGDEFFECQMNSGHLLLSFVVLTVLPCSSFRVVRSVNFHMWCLDFES